MRQNGIRRSNRRVTVSAQAVDLPDGPAQLDSRILPCAQRAAMKRGISSGIAFWRIAPALGKTSSPDLAVAIAYLTYVRRVSGFRRTGSKAFPSFTSGSH